ncbi:cyclic nucleotide-binding domain-containing protein [Komarekiella delphini-convector]|uniref:cyclic nucleotide-binding domain-containing protein n=1 Tax=Komarekiella delphini-convector TaxID=3050158 RepID=UPI0032AF4477
MLGVANQFYLILEGEAEISVSDRPLSKLKPGESFGNAQLIDGQNYPFTVRAAANTDVEVMTADRESFCKLLCI